MGLHEYHRKRDFKKTAEPRGAVGKTKKSGLQFVIQKHDASRLHYDFRLELEGVLKSWAVPKGPNFDPKVKALAVQVEDHPLDYGEFEGVIPDGEYGGGTVMLWDRGTWAPVGDADAGIKAGKIHFHLDGEKLKGEWALIRMHGRGDDGSGKNWLLFKVADEHASSTANVTQKKDKSVKTQRSLEQIADQRDDVWNKASNKAADESGAKKSALPESFSPQLAVLSDKPPVGDGWIHEIKFDGYRILAFVKNGTVKLITRNGKDYTDKFPAIAKSLEKLKADSALLDGELCALSDDGKSNFGALQGLVKNGDKANLVYYVFDLPFFNAVDLRETPLLKRKEILEKLVADSKFDTRIHFSEHFVGDGSRVVDQACHMALEGIISKKADSPYVSRRDSSWLKSKCQQRQEMIVVGYSDPQGARNGFGALLLGYYDENKQLTYSGRVGTGFDDKTLRSIYKQLQELAVKQSSVGGPIPARERRAAHWVKPELVAEVTFTEWTSDGALRHPVFVGLRADKPATQVVREKPISTAKVTKKLNAKEPITEPKKPTKVAPAKVASDSVPIAVAGVRLTHPDKSLYPEAAITKQQVADYYTVAAEWMLPSAAGRPLALVRCPDGLKSKCFFQRNWTPSLAKDISKVDVGESKEKDWHVTVADVAGLVSLVQMSVLEVHTWNCCNEDVEHPDQLVFDLDPGEGVTWTTMIEAGRKLRKTLTDLKLPAFVKTSGGKGLHITLPIKQTIDWDSGKRFCEEIAKSMVAADDLFVANMRKDLRGGKIYIDYHRNGRSATAVAPYSTRAREGAAVSMPVSWNELGKLSSAAHFKVETAPRYLQKRKTDPWHDFEQSRIDLRKLVGG